MTRWIMLVGILAACQPDLPTRFSTEYFVSVDPSFSADQQQAIVEAVEQWQRSVNNPRQLTMTAYIGYCADNPKDPYSQVCVVPSTQRCAGESVGCTLPPHRELIHEPSQYCQQVWIDNTVADGVVSHVAQHELGHALGLGHTQPGTVMYYGTEPFWDVQPGYPNYAAQDVTMVDVDNYIDSLTYISDGK